jgi:hypothetical protein
MSYSGFYTMEVEGEDDTTRDLVLETNDSENDSNYDETSDLETGSSAMDLSFAMANKTVASSSSTIGANINYERPELEKKWELDDDMLLTYKWLSMYESTSIHMYVCHEDMEYVRNERYAAEVYKELYHKKYGNAYEFYVKQIKLMITTRFLEMNRVAADMLPAESVDKTKDMIKLSFFLHCKTRNGLTLKEQVVYALHSVNLIGLSFCEIQEVNSKLPNFVTVKSMTDLKSKYNWRSEEDKVRRVRSGDGASFFTPVQQMFKLSFDEGSIVFRTDSTLDHTNYLHLFQSTFAAGGKKDPNYVDCVSNLKWLYKDIVNVLCDRPALGNMKAFESDETEVEEFLKLSHMNPVGHLIFHTKTKHRNREHYRLNCFRMDRVHVWVNSMVFDKKDATKKLDLEGMIERSNWGTHYIVRIHYVYNLKLAKLHTEAVKLVVRYILERRDFNLLHKDLESQPKMDLKFINCN